MKPTKYIYAFIFIALSTTVYGQTTTRFIADQFGYLKDEAKVAILRLPQIGYDNTSQPHPGFSAGVNLLDSSSNSIFYTSLIQNWNGGNTHAASGDKGILVDFSAFNGSGNYLNLFDTALTALIGTGQFEISADPYIELLPIIGRGFYYLRCNAPKYPMHAGVWSDGVCFSGPQQDIQCAPVYAPNNTNMVRDYSGGWFDSKDYNKYVSTTYNALHNLLTAYEDNPTIFGDNWDIPESGNGIPDIIDEVKWETDWLLKMVEPDGRVPNKVGSKDSTDNMLSPPSANSDRRYYGNYCTSASVTVSSVLAHAAIVMSQYPSLTSYVDSLKNASLLCFNYIKPKFLNNTLETNCDNLDIQSKDTDLDIQEQKDRAVCAAIYLWELTNAIDKKNFIDSNYMVTYTYLSGEWDAPRISVQDALLRYAFHTNSSAASANNIKNSINLALQNNVGNYWGWNTDDLYRAYCPVGTYQYGSNELIADYGNINQTAFKYNLGQNPATYRKKAVEQIHYFHGLNPNVQIFMTNIPHGHGTGGSMWVNYLSHPWTASGSMYSNPHSNYGPPPGLVVSGANVNYNVQAHAPLANQPPQKSYKDFNNMGSDRSWEVNEPGIYYQASYLRLLSSLITSAPPSFSTSLSDVQVRNNLLVVYPNPSNHSIHIGAKGSSTIYNLNGQVVLKSQKQEIDISELASGQYIIILQMTNGLKQNGRFTKY